MTSPNVQRAYLLNTTIVPELKDAFTFNQFLTRVYEDIAYAVNQRDFVYFPIAVPPTPAVGPPLINPQPIQNMPLYGSFLVCISGIQPGLPCATYAVNKADIYQAGVYTLLSSQAGNIAPWVGFNVQLQDNPVAFRPITGEIDITIFNTSTMTGNFNIRVISTQ